MSKSENMSLVVQGISVAEVARRTGVPASKIRELRAAWMRAQPEAVRLLEYIREVNDNARATFDVEAFEIAKQAANAPRAIRFGTPTLFRGVHATLTLEDVDGARIYACVNLLDKSATFQRVS